MTRLMILSPLTLCLLLIAAPPAIAQEAASPPKSETWILVPDVAGAETTSAISRLSPSSLRLGGSEVFDQAISGRRGNVAQLGMRLPLKVKIGLVVGLAVLVILWLNSDLSSAGDLEGGAASQRFTSAAVAVAPRMANGPRSLQLSVRF